MQNSPGQATAKPVLQGRTFQISRDLWIVSLQDQESPPPSQVPDLLGLRVPRNLKDLSGDCCKSEVGEVLFLLLPQSVLSQTLRLAGLVLQQAAEQNELWLMIDPRETFWLPSWKAAGEVSARDLERRGRSAARQSTEALTLS